MGGAVTRTHAPHVGTELPRDNFDDDDGGNDDGYEMRKSVLRGRRTLA